MSLALALSSNGPLAAMAAWPQFILYRSQPSSRPGKTDKLPIDWRTAQMPLAGSGGAQDPNIWMDAQTAIVTAQLYGSDYGVGFVLTDRDPFWFLDIDDGLGTDGWSPLAVNLCHRLVGCAIEVSQSGKGMHVFGSDSTLPPHGNRGANGLEFYRSGRFVALTGTSAVGDAGRSGPLLPALLAEHFPPPAPAAAGAPSDWTTEPPANYDHTLDDDDVLINRMLSASSASSAFGGRATARDLWEGNEAALARTYPDSGERAYDASRADIALSQHLAYWTGRNCERMDRLMRRSALARLKWDDRPAWFRDTIMKAARQQAAYPVAGSAPTPSAPPPGGGAEPVLASDMAAHFKGCTYITDRHAVLTPSGEIMRPDQFRVRFAAGSFVLDASGKATRNAWEAFSEGSLWTRPVADSTCFRPNLPFGAIITDEGRTFVNTYMPIQVPSSPGDVTPWLLHLAKMVPVERDRNVMIAYMASVVQRPGVKLPWAMLLQGVEGNGKSLSTIDVLERAAGKRYSHRPNASDLGNKFTGWIPGKTFIGVDEIYVKDRRDVLDALKILITGHRVELQGKGSDQFTGDNCANFFFLTNHKDAVAKTDRERRYCVIFSAQQEREDLERDGMTGDYFDQYRGWLMTEGYDHIVDYLQNYAIPVELDPAGRCNRAPETASTAEAIEVSRGAVEQSIQEAIDDRKAGFCGGWISVAAIIKHLEENRLSGRVPRNKLRAVLKSLGYTPHPGLDGGRTNTAVLPDAARTNLYLIEGHLARNLTDGAAIARAYTAAQPTGAEGVFRSG